MKHEAKTTTVYYNGDVFFTRVRSSAKWMRDTTGLKSGGSSNVGKWGSGARRVFISRACFLADNHQDYVHWLTLTYRYGYSPDKQGVQKNLNNFLQAMRRKGMSSYLWTMEVTNKGELHYHVIMDAPYIPIKWINDTWARIRGDQAANAVQGYRVLNCRENYEAVSRYASKKVSEGYSTRKLIQAVSQYASKCATDSEKTAKKSKDFRLWATSSNLAGRESVTITNENAQVSAVIEGKNHKVFKVQNDFEVFSTWLSPRETKKLYDTIRVLNKREAIRRLKRAEIIEEKQREREYYRAQFNFF